MDRDKLKTLFFQMVRFGIVGVLNTGITYAVYYALSGLSEPAAWAIGYAAGMASGLLVNTRWTFRQKTPPTFGQTIRFIAMNLVTLGLSTLLVGWLTGTAGISKAISGLIAAAFSAAVNFTGSRLFVFCQ